ncbi:MULTISPECIES: hypothetical protein, partial [unclassified Mesorhizobium]|uniref:hypothetical protein n=1 Tax=unclassified Mesorhizobium TaxID=325217 RepID=UPI001AED68C9
MPASVLSLDRTDYRTSSGTWRQPVNQGLSRATALKSQIADAWRCPLSACGHLLPVNGRGIAYGFLGLEVGLRRDSLGRQSNEGETAISSLESYFGALP